jgi:hypothetical protein
MKSICINLEDVLFKNKTELCHIMTKYGSDKGNGSWHNYTIIYDYLFKNLRCFMRCKVNQKSFFF